MTNETSIVKKKMEAEVILYSGNPEISKELEKAQTLSKSNFYRVGNKTVPDSRALQWLANRKNIKTRIVDIQSERDYCRATIGGWIGNNPIPETNQIYKEATVEIMFDVEMATKLTQIIKRNNLVRDKDWEIGTDGMPNLTNPKYKTKMMDELLRMRQFALRTVVTKAERIIHSKLADTDWREADEVKDEEHEVEMVAGTPIKGKKIIDAEESKPAEETEPETEAGQMIPLSVVEGVKTPWDAIDKITDYVCEIPGLGHSVLDIINKYVTDWNDIEVQDIDEVIAIDLVEELTGFKYEKAVN